MTAFYAPLGALPLRVADFTNSLLLCHAGYARDDPTEARITQIIQEYTSLLKDIRGEGIGAPILIERSIPWCIWDMLEQVNKTYPELVDYIRTLLTMQLSLSSEQIQELQRLEQENTAQKQASEDIMDDSESTDNGDGE